MNLPDEQYVYHGSHELFETVEPKRQRRSRKGKEGEYETIFDEVSFHSTPYRWIALAYIFTPKKYLFEGKTCSYLMGVDLYKHTESVEIFGFESLEKSLQAMYCDGGYLFVFDKQDFFYTEGLGNLEVITKDNLKPFKIERIDDPVAELKKLGITFGFVDLAKPENADLR